MANDKQRGELDSMTKDELIDYAEERDITVHQGWLKDDIITAILKGQKAAAKPEAKPDSLKHHEDRRSKIQAESATKRQGDDDDDDADRRRAVVTPEDAENQEIANFKGLPQHGETREELLARIRKLRDEKPNEAIREPFRSEGLQKEFEAEQKAGQEAVAKAQEERERNRKSQRELEAGEKNQTR